MINTALWWRF